MWNMFIEINQCVYYTHSHIIQKSNHCESSYSGYRHKNLGIELHGQDGCSLIPVKFQHHHSSSFTFGRQYPWLRLLTFWDNLYQCWVTCCPRTKYHQGRPWLGRKENRTWRCERVKYYLLSTQRCCPGRGA